MSTRSYQEFIERKQREYGDRWDASALAPQFIPYYESQERIRVRSPHGDIRHGTVGVTTGWRPAFLLMRSSRAVGSSDLLNDEDQVVAVKRNGRTYDYIRS